MTDYYVKPSTGDDITGAGTSGDEYASIPRAIAESVNGDTIYVDADSAANAHRLPFYLNKNVTIRPVPGKSEFFHLGSSDASEGASYIVPNSADYMQEFTTPNTLSLWNAYAVPLSVSLDNTGELMGTDCLLMDGAGNPGIRINFAGDYHNSQPMKVKVLYKVDATGVINLQIRGAASGNAWGWDIPTGAWTDVSATAPHDNLYTSTSWAEVDTGWITPPPTDVGGQFQIKATVADVRIQRIQRERKFVWQTSGSGNKVTYYDHHAGIPGLALTTEARGVNTNAPIMFYCTNTEWAANDLDALKIVNAKSSEVALVGGDSYYNSSDNTITFKVPSGETFADLHIEYITSKNGFYNIATGTVIGLRGYNSMLMAGGNTGTLVVDDFFIQNTTILSARPDTAADFTFRNGSSFETALNLSLSTGVKSHGGGFTCGNSGDTGGPVLTIEGVSVDNCGDDGLQVLGDGTLNIEGMTIRDSVGEDVELTNQSGTVTHVISQVSTSGNFVEDSDTGTVNCTMNNVAIDGAFGFTGTATLNYTFNDVYLTGTNTGVNEPDTSAINENANFDFSTTFTPAITDDLYTTGTVWWGTGPRPAGGDGEPFSDIDTDVGGIQSTHSSGHPDNL